MRVFIAPNHDLENNHGISRYVNNLINQYRLKKKVEVIIPKIPKLPFLKRILWDQFYLPFLIWKVKSERVHWTNNVIGIGSLIFPKVYHRLTIHDMRFFDPIYPQFLWPPNYLVNDWYQRLLMPISIKNANELICPSRYVADQIWKHFKVKAKVVPHTVSSFWKPANLKRQPFFLTFASYSPTKNTARILEAFANCSKRPKASLTQLKIILNSKRLKSDLLAHAKNLGIEDRVEFLEGVTDRQLCSLYQTAIALVYPSLLEGFGYPILEAAACGCPVITSNFGSMKKIAPKGAILVDPYIVNEISTALAKVIE